MPRRSTAQEISPHARFSSRPTLGRPLIPRGSASPGSAIFFAHTQQIRNGLMSMPGALGALGYDPSEAYAATQAAIDGNAGMDSAGGSTTGGEYAKTGSYGPLRDGYGSGGTTGQADTPNYVGTGSGSTSGSGPGFFDFMAKLMEGAKTFMPQPQPLLPYQQPQRPGIPWGTIGIVAGALVGAAVIYKVVKK